MLKECISLAKVGHQVTYITSSRDSNSMDYQYNGVNIITIQANEENKVKRYINYFKHSFKKALDLNADVYHIHEPNLLLLGLKLKKHQKKIIFDAHENYHMYKYGMNSKSSFFSKIKLTFLSCLYWQIIKYSIKKCEYIITAGQEIADEYKKMRAKTVILNNYPLFDDMSYDLCDYFERNNEFCYVGGVNEKRKIDTIINTFEGIENAKFIYAGPISSELNEIVHKNNKNSTYIGLIDREGMRRLYATSIVGIILLSPDPNHYDIQSNKLFEYMMSGLPVICSNFPKWKEFIKKNKCGIAVNPESKEEIKQAIEYMISNRQEIYHMAINGRKAVMEEYNWYREEKKLIKLYSEVEKSYSF